MAKASRAARKFCTAGEAARILGISVWVIRAKIQAGTVPGLILRGPKSGPTYRVSLAWLERMVAKGECSDGDGRA